MYTPGGNITPTEPGNSEEPSGEIINQDGVKLNVAASTNGREFNLNDDVYEGETIKYVVT